MVIGAGIRARDFASASILKSCIGYLKSARSFLDRYNFLILVGLYCKFDPTLLLDRILRVLTANWGHGG